MIELLTSPEAWAALLTLTALEIVLGIDNVIFLSVIVSRIPEKQAKRARQIGLALALVFRILLLSLLVWLIGLTAPVIAVKGVALSWRDIILIGGGLFLIGKATHEIHAEVEARDGDADARPHPSAFFWVIVQIIVIDMVFSLDSIITAIGMAQDLEIMIAAVVIACVIMYVSSGPVAKFVAEHPTTKMLALAFLVLIGVALVADGFKFHIPRGYIYFAIAFSAVVEAFNVLARRNRKKLSDASRNGLELTTRPQGLSLGLKKIAGRMNDGQGCAHTSGRGTRSSDL
jgi:predicted tellurium resistance membrane protein TerC